MSQIAFDYLSQLPSGLQSRSVSFENPTGAKGAGGTSYNGRKGSPNVIFMPGASIVLADLQGPGMLRHWWLTLPPAAPEIMRAVRLEVFYDGNKFPSVSVPLLDFFAVSLGRPSDVDSALASVQEARGFNAYYPMPFDKGVKVVVTNESAQAFPFYYQIDFTLGDRIDKDTCYLHAVFNRDNPTRLKKDFVIVDGLKGPGRFLGCVVGIRITQDGVFSWYGEGEVKIFLDGDTRYPTICGTGLEDYVGTAWGMGAHSRPYQGVPLEIHDPEQAGTMPDFTSFYRWHIPDPVVFERELKVTVQQIGAIHIPGNDDLLRARIEQAHPMAGSGWVGEGSPMLWGIAERIDDYCAAAFVYCRDVQAVRSYSSADAVTEIERRDYEQPSDFEQSMAALGATIS
jgi:hypothetical protein